MTKPTTRYVVIVDGEPGALGLWVPDMPGCTSMGETLDVLLQNAQEALRMWAEDALLGELPWATEVGGLLMAQSARR